MTRVAAASKDWLSGQKRQAFAASEAAKPAAGDLAERLAALLPVKHIFPYMPKQFRAIALDHHGMG